MKNMKNKKLYEQLAAIEHERWSDWQKYLHSKCIPMGLPNSDGNFDRIIPADLFLHWEKQIKTLYEELSESEKRADRDQVDRYFHLIQKDDYHTMDELYEHRYALFIALCKSQHRWNIWRSKFHSDGTMFEGYFILGIGKETNKQISYHLPLKLWNETDFVQTLDQAPLWDGHTSQDVLERLNLL